MVESRHPCIWEPQLLTEFRHVRAGLTLKGFGNMAPYVGSAPEAEGNRERLAQILDCPPTRTTWATQVHGCDIALADGSSYGDLGAYDGIVTTEPGRLLICYTADCVPVFLVSSRQPLAAVVHAGWRGTAAHVVQGAVRLMQDLGAEPSDMYAVIGPAIQGACYQVGSDTARHFPSSVVKHSDADYRVDLPRCNQLQLMEVGVPKEQIEVSHSCTHCQPELSSYRRDQDRAERMGAFLVLRS